MWVVGAGGQMRGWMGVRRFSSVKMFQLPHKLKLSLKVAGWLGWLVKLGLKVTSAKVEAEVEAELGKICL